MATLLFRRHSHVCTCLSNNSCSCLASRSPRIEFWIDKVNGNVQKRAGVSWRKSRVDGRLRVEVWISIAMFASSSVNVLPLFWFLSIMLLLVLVVGVLCVLQLSLFCVTLSVWWLSLSHVLVSWDCHWLVSLVIVGDWWQHVIDTVDRQRPTTAFSTLKMMSKVTEINKQQ